MIGWYVRPKEGLLFTYVVCQIVAGFFVQNGRPRIIILSKVDIFQISSFKLGPNKSWRRQCRDTFFIGRDEAMIVEREKITPFRMENTIGSI